jgi:hypothetical protein
VEAEEREHMLTALLTTVLPGGSARNHRRSASEKYSLYLSQQAAHHHYDSLCLALNVLEHVATPSERAEWLLRVEEAADKCIAAVEECISLAD